MIIFRDPCGCVLAKDAKDRFYLKPCKEHREERKGDATASAPFQKMAARPDTPAAPRVRIENDEAASR